jgi:hypothetical protein
LHGYFDRGEMAFLAIALFAANDTIILGTSATSGDRHDVIHSELLFGELTFAIVANPSAQLLLPPAAGAQFLSFATLSLYLFGIDKFEVILHAIGSIARFPSLLKSPFFCYEKGHQMGLIGATITNNDCKHFKVIYIHCDEMGSL